MTTIDRLLATFAPYDCLQCGAEGVLLCENCVKALPPTPDCCYRCEAPSAGSLTCSSCSQVSPLAQVLAVTRYEGRGKDLIWKLKSDGAQSAAVLMATAMSKLPFPRTAIIVPVPTATGRIRRRGYDHVQLIARALARKTGLSVADCLRRSTQAHQVGATREQRLSQLSKGVWAASEEAARGRSVLLVDDVVTTGASLEVAARALHAAGAREVCAVVYARTAKRAEF